MSKVLLFVRTHTYTILLYLISIFVIFFLFPREGIFPYEFQMGKIWGHSDLYAPFDFPILKTQQELVAETDSVEKTLVLYYNYHPDIVSQQLNLLNQSYGKQLEASKLDARRNQYLQGFCTRLLDSIYSHGIIQEAEGINFRDASQIIVIKNNVGEEVEKNNLYTQKTAYETIISKIDQLTDNDEKEFLKSLDLNNYLLPNLSYNADITKNVKQERIDKISRTKGLVPLNRKIISHGEVVNEEKYSQLQSLKYEFENTIGRSGSVKQVIVGQFAIIALCFMMVYLYLMHFRKEIFRNITRTGFILLIMVIFTGISCLVVRNEYFNLYVLPLTLMPLILCTFFDTRTATFIFMVTVLLIGFLAPNGFEYVFLNLVTGIVAVVNVKSIYRRGTLFKAILWIILTYVGVYTAIILSQGISSFHEVEWKNYIWFALSGILLFVTYPCIYLFEKAFGFLSDVTLMELSDTNQPLLRQLAEVAPGTFQHSLQVANLSEEVIQKIGGNPLLARTAALYHDIGKITRPFYFIENQGVGKNPHEDLSPENSAQIIIEHVFKGVEIAKKHRVPQQVIDFIRTHHGTTTVRFFYHAYQKQHTDKRIDRSKFTYPGPIPFSKEMVVLMMCDSIEAASRSLKDVNQWNISDLVDNIINYQVLEDQYNDANITYREINIAKQIIKNRLMNMHHVRIEYPKAEPNE